MGLWVSKQVTYNDAFLASVVAAFKTNPAAALMLTPRAHFFQNNFSPGPHNVLADFTDATFSGYVAGGVFLSGPVALNANSQAMLTGGTYVATVGAPFVPNVLYGWYLVDTGGTILYCSERFDAPIPISAPGDYIDFTLALPLPYYAAAF